jgi:hypothetical protein
MSRATLQLCRIALSASMLIESLAICEFLSLPFCLPFLTDRTSQHPGIQPKLEALRNLYEGKKIIVGRDKLDVVKGVVQKVTPSARVYLA